MNFNYVSFPGLGLEQPIKLNPVAFTVFGINVMWYGVIITCGMLLAYLYGRTRAKVEKVKTEDITDLTLFLVIFGVIGARLYYILFKLDEFIARGADGSINVGQTLKAMVNLRNGGLAIYGGIIAGFITMLVVARIKRIRFPVLADIVAPCLFIGQAIGRWGNFMNVEAYGTSTALPWRMGIGNNGVVTRFVHPTFLYESLWNLVGFILIAIFYKKKKFHGQVFLFYGIWYGIGRAWIEGLRTDSLMLGSFRVSQLLSILIVVAFSVLMVLGMKKALAAPVEGEVDEGDEDSDDENEKADDAEKSDDDSSENGEADENAGSDGTEADEAESNDAKADEAEAKDDEAEAEAETEENAESESEEAEPEEVEPEEAEAAEEDPATSVYGEAPSESEGAFEPIAEDEAVEEAPEDDASDGESAGTEALEETESEETEDGKDN